VTLDDLLAENYPDAERPWLDRAEVPLVLDDDCRSWRDTGVCLVRAARMGPDWPGACDAYSAARARADGWEWQLTPYMRVPELQRVCCDGVLADVMEKLVGEPVGLHLNLCGQTTSDRDWHADVYLSGDFVKDHYVAAWVALGDIGPDCGPFEYAPGSHRWGRLDQQKVIDAMLAQGLTTPARLAGGEWPKDSEKLLTPLFDAKGAETRAFLAQKGDVLLWHPLLWHRGSPARVPGTPRPAVIGHYSGVNHRKDFSSYATHPLGGRFFLAGPSKSYRPEGK
jgi:hypothetical protein